jgi:hypothetical protein
MSWRRAVLVGGVVVGVLDILDAFVFFYLRAGVSPTRILQSIASGLLGRAAFEGGAATAALGLGLHFVIALTIVLGYALAARRIPALASRPMMWGSLYGVAVYGVMNLVVIPLSAIGSGRLPSGAVLVNGLLIHVLGVGIPSAWFARAGRAPVVART